MKLIKFLLVLMIACFAFVTEATSDPPNQDGMETIIYQNSNSDVLTVNPCASIESNRYGARLEESQFLSLSNEIMKAESNLVKFRDYCYMSRHRRTKNLCGDYSIRNDFRCKNEKRDPRIRGHDQF